MSDSYQALVDCTATPDQAPELRDKIVEFLAQRRLIVPTLSDDCVLDGVGYPAGAACHDVFRIDRGNGPVHGVAFWTHQTSGIQVLTEPWVNVMGFPQFSYAQCPLCQIEFDEEVLGLFGETVEDYLISGVLPRIECPHCGEKISVHRWHCEPHLGFANLAVIFWNWPVFDDPLWNMNLAKAISSHLGRELTSTFGRL